METEKRVMGALPKRFDIRDYKIRKGLYKTQLYPERFECERITSIKNQGCVGSCVAHGVAEILEHHFKGTVKLSTDFIYGIRNKLFNSRGEGMNLREACKIAHDYGDPEFKYCPTNTEVDKVFEIAAKVFDNKEAMNNALMHTIDSYAALGTKNSIKYALMNYGPVLGAIYWYEENECINGIVTKGTTLSGGHCIVIRGWTENGWVCQNSWGESWGDHGYFILPFDYKLNEAYSFVPIENTSDIVKPKINKFMSFIYKVINFVINLFRKK